MFLDPDFARQLTDAPLGNPEGLSFLGFIQGKRYFRSRHIIPKPQKH